MKTPALILFLIVEALVAALAILTLLSSCDATTLELRRQETAFEREYRVDPARTIRLETGPLLALPPVLAPEDWSQIVTSMDSYMTRFIAERPLLRWPDLTIFLHPNLDWCMSRWRQQCSGWREGNTLYITWRSDDQGQPREQDPFPVLGWELGRWVAAVDGIDGQGYAEWYSTVWRHVDTEARAGAVPCLLSDWSRAGTVGYEYVPWTER